ncbi:MAG: type II toxin-antitoxin system CcdA family antitoxin [Bauldia sp.]|nr:type II toxin-antitoxin system CcdA family antitoxin [Bauldia sp.]
MARDSTYDHSARKRTVSLTLNGDLYAKAKELGINASRVAEEALAAELTRVLAEKARAEVAADLDAFDRFVAEHGSPAAWVREHYPKSDDAV